MATLASVASAGGSGDGGTSGDRFRRDRAKAEHYSVDVGVGTRGHAPRVCTVHRGFLREDIIAKAISLCFSFLVSLSSDCFGFGAVRWSGSDNDNGSTVAG